MVQGPNPDPCGIVVFHDHTEDKSMTPFACVNTRRQVKLPKIRSVKSGGELLDFSFAGKFKLNIFSTTVSIRILSKDPIDASQMTPPAFRTRTINGVLGHVK